MRRVCFPLKVREDRIDEYRERHVAVWPETLEALSATGWRDHSLFPRDDGLLVATWRPTTSGPRSPAWRPPRSTPAGRRRWHRSSSRWTVPGPTRP